jgi:hypothetical protein
VQHGCEKKMNEEFMMGFFERHWSIIMVLALLSLLVGICCALSVRQNDGHFVYAVDDAYIHMAMAKNFSQHGVWGITKYEFTSSSSSLLWTLVLSLMFSLFGTNELSCFILSLIFALCVCILAYTILRKYDLRPLCIFFVLCLIVFSTPLPALIFGGMEHTLQFLITLSFVYFSAKILTKQKPNILELLSLSVMGQLLVMTRFEGLFLVFIVGILFALKRRPLAALSVFSISIIPIVIYGFISVSKGWPFLPISVLMKGNRPDLFSLKGIVTFFYLGFAKINNPHVLIPVLVALGLFIYQYQKRKTIWKDTILMVVIFIAITFLHMLFARTGHFYRYEAYLVGLGIVVIAIAVHEELPQNPSMRIDKALIPEQIAIFIFVLLAISPFSQRALISLREIPQATNNIYEQQYQMGLFLRKFYQGQAVAANDAGAINFLADIKFLDLYGLGTLEIGKARIDRCYSVQQISDLTESSNVKIAVFYDEWFEKKLGIPQTWVKVGEWKLSNNVVCADDTVGFYAIDPAEADNLIENLKGFK